MEQTLTSVQPSHPLVRSSGLLLGDVVLRLVKYVVEGLAVAGAAWLVTSKGKRVDGTALVLLGVTAAAVFAILDLFAPAVGAGTRQGAGFGLGFGLVGVPPIMPGVPPMV